MSVMFDGLILAETLAFLLESLLIWHWCRRLATDMSTLTFLWTGGLIGLLANVRGTALLLLIPAIWLAIRSASTGRRSLTRAAAAAAGCAVLVLPSLLWNWSSSHELIPLTYNFGFNLYVRSNPRADGGYVLVAGDSRMLPSPAEHPDGGAEGDGREYLRRSRGLDLSPAQSSTYWTTQHWTSSASTRTARRSWPAPSC